MTTMLAQSAKHDLLTVILEDYFHVSALRNLISLAQWNRFETRFECNTLKSLDLLKEYDIRATFFVLGWIAERRPDLIAEVARQGHEIASYGFDHRDVRQLTREEFRDDLRRSRAVLEIAAGRRVVGYRIPQGLRSSSDYWVLDVLAEEGYIYDSSVVPFLRARTRGLRSRYPYLHQTADQQTLWEFPYSSLSIAGHLLPISGGNYIRQIPHSLLKHAVSRWKRNGGAPYMLYFHVWELDPDQPRISAASMLARTRHYRKLDKMNWVLREYFQQYRFGSIAEYLKCNTAPAAGRVAGEQHSLAARMAPVEAGIAPRKPVTIVVPCYNEAPTLPYLANTLESVRKLLAPDYDVQFLFVDDGSCDATWDLLNRFFGQRSDCRMVRHPKNLGVAAAILTGIRHATSELVCSIDCDCSYDPHDLLRMIPVLTDDVDLVTASPYHPQGRVVNVAWWRKRLSKGASWLYGKILRHKLFTYTSCFRVYRRSAVVELQVQESGFLGVAEMLGVLDLRGFTIREFPAILQTRILGRSKMKVVNNIVGHLRNLWRLRKMRRLLDQAAPIAGQSPDEGRASRERSTILGERQAAEQAGETKARGGS